MTFSNLQLWIVIFDCDGKGHKSKVVCMSKYPQNFLRAGKRLTRKNRIHLKDKVPYENCTCN